MLFPSKCDIRFSKLAVPRCAARQVVVALVEARANVGAVDSDKMTALMHAANKGHNKVRVTTQQRGQCVILPAMPHFLWATFSMNHINTALLFPAHFAPLDLKNVRAPLLSCSVCRFAVRWWSICLGPAPKSTPSTGMDTLLSCSLR